MKFKRMGVAAAALLLMQAGAHAQSLGFSLTILDAGVPLKTTVAAINDFGQIVGTVGDGGGRHGVLWRGGVAYDLGMPTHATGINNLGQVSGDESFSEPFYDTAMVWTSATPTRLGSGSSADAINDAGQVVGTRYSYQSDHFGGAERAMRWDGTTAHILNSPAGNTATEATSINNAGQVVGGAYTSSCAPGGGCSPVGQVHATLWNGDQPVDLGTLGGDASLAFDINNKGQVIGVAQTADGVTHGALWGSAGAATDLGVWQPNAINDSGLIVGVGEASPSFQRHDNSPYGTTYAALWDGQQLLDLNGLTKLYQGWYLTSAFDINNVGQVIGMATNIATGVSQPFLLSLTSVPEPSSAAMMLLGCGALALRASRRRAPPSA